MFVTLESNANPVVVDPQVTIAVSNDGLRHHLLHFLCHDADIRTIAAVVTEAIVTEAVGEMTKQDDVVLDGDIGTPSAAATTTATEATASAPTEATATAEATVTTAAEGATMTNIAEGAAVDIGAMTDSRTLPGVS